MIEGKCKIRPKSSYPLKPSRKCLFCLMYKTITSIQKNLMSLLRMKRTLVNSWRGLIASPTAHILYQPPELLISKRRKTFPALVHNTKRQMVWNDLRRFSSFLKNLKQSLCKASINWTSAKPLGKFLHSERRRILNTREILPKKSSQPL